MVPPPTTDPFRRLWPSPGKKFVRAPGEEWEWEGRTGRGGMKRSGRYEEGRDMGWEGIFRPD